MTGFNLIISFLIVAFAAGHSKQLGIWTAIAFAALAGVEGSLDWYTQQLEGNPEVIENVVPLNKLT